MEKENISIIHLDDEAQDQDITPNNIRDIVWELLDENVRETLTSEGYSEDAPFPWSGNLSYCKKGKEFAVEFHLFREENALREWLVEDDEQGPTASKKYFILDLMNEDRFDQPIDQVVNGLSNIVEGRVDDIRSQAVIYTGYETYLSDLQDDQIPMPVISKGREDIYKFVLGAMGFEQEDLGFFLAGLLSPTSWEELE